MAMRPQDRYKSTTAGAVSANRNYKDTVFRMLFSDKKNLLSLYNAVNSRDYTNPDDLEIVTLENAIYMGMKNDLAFIIDTNLYLYEHQSTYNPNMPLRDLFYISSEYQKMLDQKSLYSSSLQKIPTPNFIEFYNGSDPVCDVFEHRLSSAFEHLSGEPKLELIVTVLNINEGHNALLMEHCKTLREYAQYVAKVRKYTADMSLNEAVECAVDECIKENILADFLRKNRAEVISMSIFEYDKEEEEKKLRKAEYEAGIQKGVLNTARHLLELNLLSLENISRATGLSIDELKKLQQELNIYIYYSCDSNLKTMWEVISMSIFEYDKEEEEKKLRKAEYEAGVEAGEKSGIQKGVLNTARHLLELNLLSLENISRATGLSIDELKKLQQ